MRWHVDPVPFKSDEEKVLSGKGQTYLVPGTCICKGEIRNILASKFPLYVNGEIEGLMGYFIDVTDWKSRDIEISNLFQNDPMTGTLNFLGLMEALLKYQDGYALNGTDFVMVMFDVSHFHLFMENYGHEWCEHLIKEIADRIRNVVGVEGIAGRLYVDRYMLVMQHKDEKQIEEIIRAVEEEIDRIAEVDGVPCTVYMYSAYTMFSEAKDLQVLFEETEKKVLAFGTS